MRRSRRRWMGLGLLVGVAGLAGCREHPESGKGVAEVQVTVAEVQSRSVPVSIQGVGRLRAKDAVDVRARVQGFVVERLFTEGARVKEGELLYRIDPAPFEADLAVADARLERARARLTQAERESQRLEKLFQQQATSEKERQDALTQLLEARADVRLSEAQRARAALDLSYTEVRSPFDGVVGEAVASVGDLVDAGPNALLTRVIVADPIEVAFGVSEQEGLVLGRGIISREMVIPEGTEPGLKVTLADGRVYGHPGTVSFVAPELDPQSGTILVRGSVPNPELKLKPGMFVRVALTGIERPGALLVPQRAVVQSAAGAFVYVVDSAGKVAARPVTLGDWYDEAWVVRSGVEAGEKVVVEGVQKVRPGMTVRVASPNQAPLPPTGRGR